MDINDVISHYKDYQDEAIINAKLILERECNCTVINYDHAYMAGLKPSFVVRTHNDREKKGIAYIKVVYRPNGRLLIRDKRIIPFETSLMTGALGSNFILFIYTGLQLAKDCPEQSIRFGTQPSYIKKAEEELELGTITNCHTLDWTGDQIVRLDSARAKYFWQDWRERLQELEAKFARK